MASVNFGAGTLSIPQQKWTVVVFSLGGLPHWFPHSRIHSLPLDIQRTVQFT